MSLSHYTKAEIESDISRVEAIIRTGIFEAGAQRNPLFQSALTELLIRVRDLLAKSQNHARRICFTDDVMVKGHVTDVTSLVTFVRDAICHIDSKKNDHDEIQARISFSAVFGKACLAQIGATRIESEYEDDIAFFFGSQRLYFKRHIMRAYREAVAELRPLLGVR